MIPRIAAHFSTAALRELQDLEGETDSELRQAGLWSLAQRLEQEERLAGAADLYGELAGEGGLSGFPERARKRLELLQGNGGFGPRAEIFLRRLARDATSPTAIVAMGVGSLAFRLTRVAFLSRLASSAEAGFFTRGLGLRFAASLGGFGAETAAFTLAGKTTASLSGENVDWSPRALGRDWLGGAMTLGSLRVAGAWTEGGLRRWAAGNSAADLVARRLAPNFALFGGILLGQGLERRLGLRADGQGSDVLLDGLATFLNFKAGAAVAGRLLGNSFLRFERRLDLAAEGAGTLPPRSVSGPSLAFAMSQGPSLPAERGAEPRRSHIFLSENRGPGGGKNSDPLAPRPGELRQEGGAEREAWKRGETKSDATPPDDVSSKSDPLPARPRPIGNTIPPLGSLTTLAGLGKFLHSPQESPMTADQALQALLAGNHRFVTGAMQHPRQDAAQRQALVEGQKPFASVLACVDSRTPPDLIFDQGLGDLFVVRVAGNYVDEAVLGSLEYGVGVVKTPLLMVVGHEGCGMIRAAIADQPLPGKIEVLAQKVRAGLPKESPDLPDRQTWAAQVNIRRMVRFLQTQSEVISPLYQAGKVRVVGAYHLLGSGRVEVLEP
ncbi:MAG: carbonic anhydrase [bacterium]